MEMGKGCLKKGLGGEEGAHHQDVNKFSDGLPVFKRCVITSSYVYVCTGALNCRMQQL